jgi:hypothetical protein
MRDWFEISLRTFGGPAGQIAVMHRELVDERRWNRAERGELQKRRSDLPPRWVVDRDDGVGMRAESDVAELGP